MRPKKRFALLFLSAIVSTSSYASYPQDIQVCLNIENNNTPYQFHAGFVSHDFFDSWKRTQYIFNGTVCVNHHYQSGPKSIKLVVEISQTIIDIESVSQNIIVLDSSCSFLANEKNASVKTPDYLRTADAHQYWDFTLSQLPPRPGFHYAYSLKCKHWSN